MGQRLNLPQFYLDEVEEAEMKMLWVLNPPTKSSIRAYATKKLGTLQEQQLLWGYTKEREEEIESLKSFLEKA